MGMQKEIKYSKVYYQRNVDLGIDPECYECTSHATNRGKSDAVEGYPILRRKGKTWLMHRYLFHECTGENPEVVMHLCDNRKCININHLKAGTNAENMKDMSVKGRSTIGEKSARSKLTEEEIKSIKIKLAQGQQKEAISKEYDISTSQIRRIELGKQWKGSESMTDINEIQIKVVQFGREMIKKFIEHSYRQGWSDLNSKKDLFEFLNCLKEEVEELEQALKYESDENVIKEAADVSNYCLIIADLVRRTNRGV